MCSSDPETILSATVLALALTGDALLYVVLPAHAADFGVDLALVGILLSANRIIRIFGYGAVVAIGDATDSVVLNVSRHDEAEQRIVGQFVELTNGSTVRLRPWVVRYLLPRELDAVAGQAGLRLLERHADGGSEAFTPESRRHVSVYCPA